MFDLICSPEDDILYYFISSQNRFSELLNSVQNIYVPTYMKIYLWRATWSSSNISFYATNIPLFIRVWHWLRDEQRISGNPGLDHMKWENLCIKQKMCTKYLPKGWITSICVIYDLTYRYILFIRKTWI